MTSHHNRMQWKTPALHLPLPPLLALGTQATAAALRIGLSPTGSGFSARLSPLVLASGPPHTGRGSGLLDTMVKLTMIARVTDGLPLAEGLDDGRDLKDSDFYKQQAKLLFKNLSKGHHEASRMSIETGPYYFHYIIEGRVCYLTMCDRSYPKKLAFQYLEDLKNEFERVNGNQIETAARPYAFIKFDTFIQKTRKLYLDTRTQRNLAKLNDELYEVHQIMTRNVQEVLGVGEKLDQVSEMSSRLTSDTRIYADKAKDLNRQALIRKYAPVAIVIGVVLMLFWLKNKIW
ncbi:25.3 kDa vesicle transport protein [Zea mays]|uniref:25.3 kDa vesicle transport protein n=3 Tax=Zea mays TaxID=4577 RepID=A0A1D6L7E0_MAIZE|nr:25.3 kDa vesicle transport protein [Zea mays]